MHCNSQQQWAIHGRACTDIIVSSNTLLSLRVLCSFCQVCDDSTREEIKRRIDSKVAEMQAKGHNCTITRRPTNKGYKAGNMLHGMAALEEVPWEFVAIFDADFEMPSDFLYQTIWHMVRDSKLGFVQTRWTFTNGYDNLLCW